MKTAMQEAIEYLKSFNLEASAVILEDKFLEKEKEQAIDLIKETAMLVSAANIDKDIAKLTYEDVYNLFYNQNK